MTSQHQEQLADALGANTIAQIHATQSTEGSTSDLRESLTTARHATDESTATSSFLSSNVASLTGVLQENLAASESLQETIWHMTQANHQATNALVNSRNSTDALSACLPPSTLSTNQLAASTDNLAPKIESLAGTNRQAESVGYLTHQRDRAFDASTGRCQHAAHGALQTYRRQIRFSDNQQRRRRPILIHVGASRRTASAAAHDDRGSACKDDDHRENQCPSEAGEPPHRSEDSQDRGRQEQRHSRMLPDHRQRGVCPLLVDFLTSHVTSVLRVGPATGSLSQEFRRCRSTIHPGRAGECHSRRMR